MDGEQRFLLLIGVQAEPEAFLEGVFFFLLAGWLGHIDSDNSGMIASVECQVAEEVLMFGMMSLFYDRTCVLSTLTEGEAPGRQSLAPHIPPPNQVGFMELFIIKTSDLINKG